MKKLSLYGLTLGILAFAGAVSTSCSTVDAGFDADATAGLQPVIELTFDAGPVTRADDITAFTEAEKQMSTVDLFFYPTGGTGNAPVKIHRIANTEHDTKHTVSLSDEEFEALFGTTEKTDDGTCVVYAVVNVSDADFAAAGVEKASATPAKLRTIKATTPTFATEFAGFAMVTKNPDGDAVSYKGADKKAAGTIKLKNLAAKIDLLVNFEPDVQGVDPNDTAAGSQTWNVATNDDNPTAEVHILNGVSAVLLSGFDADALEDADYYSIRFNDEYVRTVRPLAEGDPDYDYKEKSWYATSAPYYSYPNSWEETPLEQHRTSLLLKVDWVPEEGDPDVPSDWLTTYYSVPLALDDAALESNKYYRVKVNINTLGGQNFGEPLEIEGSLEVLDWGEAELEADIRELRYLEVSQKQKDRDAQEYTAVINGNDGLVTIPFRSSHKAVIRSVQVKYINYQTPKTSGSGRSAFYESPGQPASLECTASNFEKSYEELMNNNWHCAYIDNVNHTITVKHNLGWTTQSSNYYYPNVSERYLLYSYEIKIVLQHENYDPRFELDEITIIHHPAIYIDAETNEVINDTQTRLTEDATRDRYYKASGVAYYHYGWVRVNSNSHSSVPFGGLNGITKSGWGQFWDTGSNNPIMYIINTTQLDATLPYHVRDPRVTQENHNLGATWASAPHYVNGSFVVAGNSHQLSYYYPTDETEVDEVKYAISPRFRVSSSFGACERSISMDDARRRCASYQEAGYPAGRWRLPTYGEMAYATYLSSQGLIPPVFGGNFWGISVDVTYWTAHGSYRVNDNGELEARSSGNIYVRCVYDDWYWVKEDGTPDKIADPYNNGQVFVWGDKPKNNPQQQPEAD